MEKYYAVENAMSYADILKYGGDATDFFLLDRFVFFIKYKIKFRFFQPHFMCTKNTISVFHV